MVANTSSQRELLQLVSFRVGPEEFAAPILAVREINRSLPVSPLPQGPSFINGVARLRGRNIPITDLRNRFGLGEIEHTPQTRTIIFQIDSHLVGLTVDQVNEVLRLDARRVETPPRMMCGNYNGCVDGISKLDERLLILLDMERLFTDEEVSVLDRIVHGNPADAA